MSQSPEKNPTPLPDPVLTPTPLPPAQRLDTPTSTPGPEPPVAGPSTTPVPQPARRVVRKPKVCPLTFNVKNPAGFFAAKEANVEVARQISQSRAKRQREDAEVEAAQEVNPLDRILIIHPGSRNLRFGRASDFYPREVPNCIARPSDAPHRGRDPPVPGHCTSDEVDTKIGYLRDYLKHRLIQNKLATDWRDASRVVAANAKVRPEGIPEHNDPYRIDWTETDNREWFVGTEALRLPPSSGFTTRWPILNRKLNTRDWQSPQALMDDIALILAESLRQELGIEMREYKNYSVVLLVPDHGDRAYVQEMTHLLLTTMGFNQIAVHQESYAAIFSAGMSSACVVDIGASTTSVTCIDEGIVASDTRMSLAYGGDDITTSLAAILSRSAFPYRELDLAKSQDWLMMDNLKIKICTLEEQLVANTPWDFYVLKTEGLTQKYIFRTFDENILAPLCFFDTRMIEFEEKKGEGSFNHRTASDAVDDLLTSAYGEPTGAMRACTTQVQPVAAVETVVDAPETDVKMDDSSRAPTPFATSAVDDNIAETSATFPLDAAIAASISVVGNENKAKTASSAILVIGGSSALKGLNAFLAERIPPLLRGRGVPIQDVHIVPPPRSVNPRFVSWKGASVMCNLESLSDMWIRRDEWESIGARALKERYLFF
ncbi:hypothetical protein DB88DRAFT_504858 [Papiliotrema laurentii]|uniref:Actin-related protein 8 n=1 Tax=Papiliotrema laurentii TaxID=5418 RepID=A0AAD9FRF3_PAPLA|nr:hypothetical protein DB88DRAFT_504858 [Papiliotrema laurentii]